MKLLPCPFCGKKAVTKTRKKEGKSLTDIGCSTLLCICWICSDKNCGCEPNGYCLKKDAIKYWNERA